jgi:DNA-binding transcriptional LysR family regulator
MDRLLTLTVFRRVAELQSFTAAARELGLSNAAVSKHVAVLEERLGTRLLQRTTRRVAATPTGAAYLGRCAQLLDELEQLDDEVTSSASTLRGTLRVNVPMSLGLLHVSPLLPAMLERWPELSLEVSLTDRMVDIVEEGVDVLLRVSRTLPDSPLLVAQRLARVGYAICGAPAYFREHGTPRAPGDLANHHCIAYRSSEWELRHGDRTTRVRIAGRLQIDSSIAIRDAVLAGAGIALLPRFYVDDLLRARRLRAVLTDYEAPPADIHVLYARQPRRSAKVRAFIELLAEHFRKAPWALT